MPFILEDQDLLNELLKHGQDFENRFTRRGQAAVNANAAFTQLLDNLESQLHPEQRPPGELPEVSTQGDKPAVLNSIALEGLGALCSFLANNAITVDGKRVAFAEAEKPTSGNYQFVQLEGNALYNESPDRKIQTQGFYVDIDLLKKYLNTLLAQLHTKPNPVMQVQLSKIIDEANKSLEIGLGKTYQPEVLALQDGQVLDSFPTAIDPAHYEADGPVQLTFGDIKSPEDLNGWMTTNNITTGGKGIKDPQFNFCAIIQTIHNKAKWHLSRATPKQKAMFTIYVQQVEKIAPSITGPDGKACQLAGATSQTGQGSEAGKAGAGDIMHVIQSLPLRQSDIDFDRIETFFNTYKSILSSNATDIAGAIDQTTNAMKAASSQTSNGMRNFPMSANAQQIGTWVFQDRAQGRGLSVIANLRYVISGTAAVIAHLKNTQGQQLGGAALAAINGQIGDEANNQGIAGNNLNHLQVMENQLNAQTPNQPGFKQRGW